jgi:hypothetical protein
VLAGFYLKSRLQFVASRILDDYGAVYVSFDPIHVGVEFLLGGDKPLVLDAVRVLTFYC